MSDTPQGPGWWQASDGKFYPPQPAQGAPPQGQWTPPPETPKKGGTPGWVIALGVVGLILVLLLGGCVVAVGLFARTAGDAIEDAAIEIEEAAGEFGEVFEEFDARSDASCEFVMEGDELRAEVQVENTTSAVSNYDISVSAAGPDGLPLVGTVDILRVPIGETATESVALSNNGLDIDELPECTIGLAVRRQS